MIRSVTRSTISRATSRVVGGDGGSGGGEPAFSPIAIEDICAWYDASDNSTVLNSIGPDIAATNNQTIRRWLDKSGNDFHLDQATGLSQPIFKTNQINSLPAVDMDAVNDFMTGTCVLNAPYTVFLVAQQRGSGSLRIVSSASPNSLISISRGMTSVFVSGNTVRATALTTVDTLASVFLHSPSVGGGNIRLFLGGTAANQATSSVAAANFGTVTIGRSTEPADALVCELATYNRDLTDDERGQLVTYAAAKWGTPS
jgi:hypothetical protein